MRRRLPLNSLRAFEAVARNGNLARAAEELCVTSTALSHQVRQMEDFLQVRLFERRNKGLALTERGQKCMAKLTDAFDLIDEAMVEATNTESGRPRLVVGASASVTSLWLMPRLKDFLLAQPGIDVSVRTFIDRSGIESQQTDLWIGNWRTHLDRKIELLMEEDIVPVCSPQVLAEFGSAAEVLRSAPLIHIEKIKTETNPIPEWENYFAEYGIGRADVGTGVRFNQASSAIEACRAGYGVMLGRRILMGAYVPDGELIELAEPYPVKTPYYVTSQWRKASPEAFDQFREWLFGQASTHVARRRVA